MPLWIWVVGMVGGLLGIGALIDYRSKKRNIRIEPDEGIKNASDSQQIYTEQYLDQVRKDTGNNNQF